MITDWLPFIGVIIVAILGAVPGVLAWRSQNRRETADATRTYMDMTDQQAKAIAELRHCQGEYETRLDQLEAQLTAAEGYIQSLEGYVDELVTAMKAGGIQPPRPRPERKRMAL